MFFQKTASRLQQSLLSTQLGDNLPFDQQCLHRLKSQRKKIQQLTDQYQNLQKQLQVSKNTQQELRTYIQELEDDCKFKEMYQTLKLDYQAVYAKAELQHFDDQQIQNQLTRNNMQLVQEVQGLKGQIRKLKEGGSLSKMQWQRMQQQKDQQLVGLRQKLKSRQNDYKFQLDNIRAQNQQLKALIKQSQQQRKSSQLVHKKSLQNWQIGSLTAQKSIQYWKKQATALKFELQNLKSEFQVIQQDNRKQMGMLLQHNRQIKSVAVQRQRRNQQMSLSAKQSQQQLQSLRGQLRTASRSNNKYKNNCQQSINRVQQMRVLEMDRMQGEIVRLKKQIGMQVDQFNLMLVENKRLRGLLERRGTRQRQVEVMVKDEMREMGRESAIWRD